MTKPAPLLAAIIALGLTVPMASAQLPQTNMGKYVHKPGDNQYDRGAQMERHPPPPATGDTLCVQWRRRRGLHVSAQTEATQTRSLNRANRRRRASAACGFSRFCRSGLNCRYQWAAGAAPVVVAVAALGAARKVEAEGVAPTTVRQECSRKVRATHSTTLVHLSRKRKKKSSYYKCNEVAAPHKPVSDQIMTGGAGGGVPGLGGAPNPGGALKSLGREPKLNDRDDGTAAPEAPQPVVINQSTTQDLSLPEDDFSGSSAKRPSKMGRKMKQVGAEWYRHSIRHLEDLRE